MQILDLPGGGASLEFDSAQWETVRLALASQYGQPEAEWIPDGAKFHIAGEKLVYHDEWDQPCLIASTPGGVAMLEGIRNRIDGRVSSYNRSNRRLGRVTTHRLATFRNLAAKLIEHEQIKTTLPMAREIRPYVEKLITLAKHGGSSNRRLAGVRLKDDAQLAKLFDVLAARYADHQGGYIRIIKAGVRKSDATQLAIVEFVNRDESANIPNSESITKIDEAA